VRVFTPIIVTSYGWSSPDAYETTASGRGRVQALPFQRAKRLQEK